jgi:NAD(P)-dependent dehydrogenase (short-subunit alcohol dehydrogenase family)
MNIDLSDRSAVVTGGAQGIGYTAKCLALAGASVWIADIQGEKTDQAAATLRADGLSVHAATLDITGRDGMRTLFEEVAQEAGALDILVNNASVTTREPFAEIDEATFDRVIGVDLKGTLICIQEAGRLMRASGGCHREYDLDRWCDRHGKPWHVSISQAGVSISRR